MSRDDSTIETIGTHQKLSKIGVLLCALNGGWQTIESSFFYGRVYSICIMSSVYNRGLNVSLCYNRKMSVLQ